MLCHVSGNMTPRLLVFLVASKKWWGSLAAEKNRSRDSMCAMEWEGMVQDFPRDPRWEGKQVRQASVLKVFFPTKSIDFQSVIDLPKGLPDFMESLLRSSVLWLHRPSLTSEETSASFKFWFPKALNTPLTNYLITRRAGRTPPSLFLALSVQGFEHCVDSAEVEHDQSWQTNSKFVPRNNHLNHLAVRSSNYNDMSIWVWNYLILNGLQRSRGQCFLTSPYEKSPPPCLNCSPGPPCARWPTYGAYFFAKLSLSIFTYLFISMHIWKAWR